MRKVLGGDMRQSGMLAAAGLVALEKMTLRLQEDHDNAKLFSLKLAELEKYGIVVDPDGVQTNMVIFEVRGKLDAGELIEKCREAQKLYGVPGVRMGATGKYRIRAVTHRNVSKKDVETAGDTIKTVLEKNW